MDKRRILRAVSAGLAIAGAVSLLPPLTVWVMMRMEGMALSAGEAASLGIIGGADGPTAIWVSGPGIHRSWFLSGAMLILGIIGCIFFRKKPE